MDEKGSIMKWKLSLAEALSFGMTIAILVWSISWFMSDRFISKNDAVKIDSKVDGVEKGLGERVTKVEAEISQLRASMSQIAVDVSYIRGRLEPKVKSN
jgi:hypothetical protein